MAVNLADLRNKALELLALAQNVCECRGYTKGGKAKLRVTRKKMFEEEEYQVVSEYAIDDEQYLSDAALPYEEIVEELGITDVEDIVDIDVISDKIDIDYKLDYIDTIKDSLYSTIQSLSVALRERIEEKEKQLDDELYLVFMVLATDD